jgi:hypothetical protein
LIEAHFNLAVADDPSLQKRLDYLEQQIQTNHLQQIAYLAPLVVGKEAEGKKIELKSSKYSRVRKYEAPSFSFADDLDT